MENAEQKKEILLQAYEDPVFFCRFFLSEWFPKHSPVPWFHMGIMALLDRRCQFLLKYGEKNLKKIMDHFVWKENPDEEDSPEHPIFYFDESGTLCMEVSRYNLVMMPRGFSKTTICNAIILKKILYKMRKFIAYVSESATHSEMQLGTVRGQLEANTLIVEFFGNLVPPRSSSKKWTDWFIECENGVRVLAKGRMGQIRGMNKDAVRPDEIVVDDVEDRESVKTDDQRLKTREWAYNDLMPALPRGDKTATITALGTLLHVDALLMTWINDPEFNSVVFGAIDKDGEPLWDSPYGMTLEDIEQKKRSYARAGQLAGFYREFMSKIRADEDAKFHPAMFKYKARRKGEFTGIALVIDPAISEKKEADSCAFAVVGMTKEGLLHVLDNYSKKGMSPREQIDKYFELSKKWHVTHHGVEAQAYQAALIHLLREEMFRKKHYFQIEAITHSAKKTERVEGVLQPRYANGYISHQRKFLTLEAELLDWPNGKKDNPDVVAMAITLLDPFAAQAADPDFDLGEDQYKDYEEEYGDDWQYDGFAIKETAGANSARYGRNSG